MTKGVGDRRLEPADARELEDTRTCPPKPGKEGDFVTAMTTASQPRDPEREVLASGTLVGRYLVLDKIAAGGMGAVYRAYDPKLDRRVAIKVVSVATDDGTASTSASVRLVREAKALAQLSHPNVVAVYDVGSHEDDVFIAMELVTGKTLRAWNTDAPARRSYKQVVELFLAAGSGLAAAHRAGIVHRDFKPGNVLIREDGRAQVVDFGIAFAKDGERLDDGDARILEESGDNLVDSVDSLQTPLSGGERLTHVGALVGTPAYMSPEQFLSQPVDERADQFSFCVALWESLYGRRPFAGTRLSDLKRNVVRGRIRQYRGDRHVPVRVRRIVERGLSASPEDRYETMGELLAELGKDPGATMRKLGLAVGAVALVVFAFLAIFGGGSAQSRLCQGAAEELSGHWDESVRASARRAFLSTNKAYADEAFGKVAAAMDRYANAWIAARTETCEATHIRGAQSDKMLDLRMGCLDRRRDALSSLASVFTGEIDADTIENALSAALKLPRLDGCADEEALTAAIPPPTDPEVRAAVERVRSRLAGARALETTARYREGLAIIEEVRPQAEATDYGPIRAEMRLLEGTLLFNSGDATRAEQALGEALMLGSTAKDIRLVARAWTRLILAAGEQANYDAGLGMLRSAESTVALAGNEPLQRADLHFAIGRLYYLQGRYDESIEHQQAALELMESVLGPEHPRLAEAVNSLGNAHYRRGNYAETRDLYQRSLDLRKRAYGTQHPHTAAAYHNLAIIAKQTGDYELSETMYEQALRVIEQAFDDQHPDMASVHYNYGALCLALGRYRKAEKLLRRSLTLHEGSFGADHPRTGMSVAALAFVLSSLEDYEQAEALARRSLAIMEKKLGSDHALLGSPLQLLGEALAKQGRIDQALASQRRAMEIRRATYGDEHGQVAGGHYYLAETLMAGKRFRDARRHYERAIEIYDMSDDEGHAEVAAALAGLGQCHLEAGTPDTAVVILERSLKLSDMHPSEDGYPRAQTEFALARALWGAGMEQARAVALAARAAEVFAADERPSAVARSQQVARWLAKRRASSEPANSD